MCCIIFCSGTWNVIGWSLGPLDQHWTHESKECTQWFVNDLSSAPKDSASTMHIRTHYHIFNYRELTFFFRTYLFSFSSFFTKLSIQYSFIMSLKRLPDRSSKSQTLWLGDLPSEILNHNLSYVRSWDYLALVRTSRGYRKYILRNARQLCIESLRS